MKGLKRLLTVVVISMLMVLASSITALAEQNQGIMFYDENGYQVYGSQFYGCAMYYNSDNVPYFGKGCYYLDEDGNNVGVYGCQVYIYDSEGNLVPSTYCYGADGNVVYPKRISSHHGRGSCCSRW